MVCRRHFNKIRNSTIVVQKFYRGWQVRDLHKNDNNYFTKINVRIAKTFYICTIFYSIFLRLLLQKIFFTIVSFIFQVRNEVKKFRYMASCTWASYIIRNYYYSWKLRKEINNRAYAKKGEPAAIVIQAYYRGWKVRVYTLLNFVTKQQHSSNCRIY